MAEQASPLFPPARWQVGVAGMVGSAALSFVHSRPLADWAYGDLAAVSAEFRQSMLTVGILVAAVAAFAPSTFAGPREVHAPLGSPRRGAQLAVATIGFVAATSTVGLTLGLLPAVWSTISSATWGSLDAAAIASGYAALLAYAALGVLLGCVLPTYAAVPVAAAAAYVLLFSTGAFAPVFQFDIVSGLVVPTNLSLGRTAFFLGAAVSLGIATSAWLRMRTVSDLRAPAAAVVVAVLPVALVFLLGRSYGGALVEGDTAAPVCADTVGPEVCVHPARDVMLAPLAGAVDALATGVGPQILPPGVVYDASVTVPEGEADYVLHLQAQETDWLQTAIGDLATDASGLGTCIGLGDYESQGFATSSAAAAWMMEEAGFDAQQLLQVPDASEEYDALRRTPDPASAIERDLSALRGCRGTSFGRR
ncbi:hypothetical protein [Nocardioides zeae]|uniref:Uncharacterized protein n=1 Tax=Nocardioides zeae TaxID=1457234 RepID=A0A6P0HLC7_9ACTN|nr:hypothetical protein [Nocardioides zeae]NEN79478.1 hypothetical protein [Nocardioides zeae]